MNRDDKIARLPATIREQANRRLQNGEAAKQIAEWLNALPEIATVQGAELAGQPLKETDLISWELGGYRNWEAQQEALEIVRQFGEDAAELIQAVDGGLADHLALCLTARLAVALREQPSAVNDAAGQLQRLRHFCAALVVLRKGDHNAQWLRIEREKLQVKLEEFGRRKLPVKGNSKNPI